MDTGLKSQLHLWKKIDNLEIVPGDRIEPTLSRTTRSVPCLLKPGSRDALIEVVRTARSNRIPLYPISRGKNWGYGAHLPVKDGCIIVSLEKFRSIRDCIPESNKIYIEAGVSQEDLHKYLQKYHPQLTFNVTGAGSDTSIIGNCLERGIGYNRSRTHELHGLEILTIDGEIIQQDNRLWLPSHPDGIGADWEGLFFQSNFGIVLGGWFSLIPRQESSTFISIQNEDLETLLEDFKTLYRNRLLSEITHIGDPSRKETMLKGLIRAKFPDLSDQKIEAVIHQVGSAAYQGITAIHGRAAVSRSISREIRKLISPTSTVDSFTPQKVRRLSKLSRWLPIPRIQNLGIFLQALEELITLSDGKPSNIGHLALTMSGDNPNLAAESAVYLNATIPTKENAIQSFRSLLKEAGHNHSVTYIVNPEEAVSAIITLHFERDETDQVQPALRILTESLIKNGFPPYRAGIDQMDHLQMPEVTKKLKDLFDPLHLIAPGRYS